MIALVKIAIGAAIWIACVVLIVLFFMGASERRL